MYTLDHQQLSTQGLHWQKLLGCSLLVQVVHQALWILHHGMHWLLSQLSVINFDFVSITCWDPLSKVLFHEMTSKRWCPATFIVGMDFSSCPRSVLMPEQYSISKFISAFKKLLTHKIYKIWPPSHQLWRMALHHQTSYPSCCQQAQKISMVEAYECYVGLIKVCGCHVFCEQVMVKGCKVCKLDGLLRVYQFRFQKPMWSPHVQGFEDQDWGQLV